MQELTDQQLIEKYLKGDEKSLEILIKRYLKPIYGFVYKNIGNPEAAQDITQEVFVKVWKNLKKVDKQKSFKSWIFTIAKNASIDFLRQKKKATLPLKEELLSDAENSLQETDLQTTTRKLYEALGELSPNYRAVVLLKTEAELSFKEIALKLNEPINTVKSRYRRAVGALRKMLE